MRVWMHAPNRNTRLNQHTLYDTYNVKCAQPHTQIHKRRYALCDSRIHTHTGSAISSDWVWQTEGEKNQIQNWTNERERRANIQNNTERYMFKRLMFIVAAADVLLLCVHKCVTILPIAVDGGVSLRTLHCNIYFQPSFCIELFAVVKLACAIAQHLIFCLILSLTVCVFCIAESYFTLVFLKQFSQILDFYTRFSVFCVNFFIGILVCSCLIK